MLFNCQSSVRPSREPVRWPRLDIWPLTVSRFCTGRRFSLSATTRRIGAVLAHLKTVTVVRLEHVGTRAREERPLRFLRLWETECLRFCASEKTASLAATAPMARVKNVRNGTSSGADSAKRTMGKPRRGAVHNTRAPRPRVRRGFPINPSRIVPTPCWQRSVTHRCGSM